MLCKFSEYIDNQSQSLRNLTSSIADTADPDFTKCYMFIDQHLCWFCNSIPIYVYVFQFMSRL